MPTLDHLLNYWEFFISADHCKSYLLCKLIVVPFMEAIFGTFTVNMPVKPTDLGILQLKFAGICHSLYIHILWRIFLQSSTLWKFSCWDDLRSLSSLFWIVGIHWFGKLDRYLDIRLLIVFKNDRNNDRFSFRFYFFFLKRSFRFWKQTTRFELSKTKRSLTIVNEGYSLTVYDFGSNISNISDEF